MEETNKIFERARAAYGSGAYDDATLEFLFPGLKENEDERMRMALISLVKEIKSQPLVRLEPWDKYIAYLENLKEQKHSLNFDAISSWLRDHASNYVNGEFNEFHHCVDYDGTIDVERLIADLKVAVDAGTFDVDAEFDTREPRDNWEYIKEFCDKFGRMPKDIDELDALVSYVMDKKQKERNDYNKLYEEIAKSEWFKKAYEGKSLGCDFGHNIEECENDKETITQKAYREGQNAGRKEVFDNPGAYGLEKIDNVFGFRIGDKVRLVDGDGRPHIIKLFEKIEGLHGPDFYRAVFEDNTASDHIIQGDEYPNGYFTRMEKIDEQKEQKPVEIHIDNPNIQKFDTDVKVTTSDSSADGKELLYVSNKSYDIGFRDGVASVKPTEWSEEDDAIHTRVLGALGKAFMGVLPTKPSQEDVEWFKSLPEKFSLQTKQEWGDGEKKVLDSIIDDYEKAAKSFCGYDGKIMLLKAIRDGEYDLSKRGWGDEDEKTIDEAVECIEKYAEYVQGGFSKQHVLDLARRVDSLRP